MKYLRISVVIFLACQLFASANLGASLDIATPDSKIVFKSESSIFKIDDNLKIKGLTKQSILSDFSVNFRDTSGLSFAQTDSHALIEVPELFNTYITRGLTLDVCNSQAIVVLAQLVNDNSNAIVHRILVGSELSKQSSDAICLRSVIGSDLSQDSSNVICQRVIIGSELAQKNSQVICDKSVTGSELSRSNSDVIIENKFFLIDCNLSGEAAFDLATANSATLLSKTKNNSNAILQKCDEIRYNSNAIVSINATVQVIKDNSNAIISLRSDLSTIDALEPDVMIDTGNNILDFSFFISDQNLLLIPENISTSPQTNIDGQGHFIHLIRGAQDVVQVGDNIRVVFENIVLRDFNDSAIQLGLNSEVVFGDGAVVELAENQVLNWDWQFEGSACLTGLGNQITLGDRSITVAQGSHVTFKDVCIRDLKDTNFRVVGDHGVISLRDVELCLARNFRFTTGSLEIKKDVLITGTNDFRYQTRLTTTICGKSQLTISQGTGFRYEPTTDNKDLIRLDEETAVLFLNGGTLKLTSTPLRLLRGNFLVDLDSRVRSLGPAQVSLSEFLAFGNGIVADDLTLEVLPCATLDIGSGIGVLYENVIA